MRFIKFLLIFLVLSIVTTGCSTSKKSNNNGNVKKTTDIKKAQRAKTGQVQKAYQYAFNQMQRGNFQTALEEYNTLILRYPFGAVTEQSKLDRIFVYERLQETESAIAAADSFISQYPSHPNIDYAHYIKGVALFERKVGFIEKRSNVRTIKNKNSLIKSKAAFNELMERYPNSQYVADAKQRVVYLNNKLADQELNTAIFYADRNAHIAAVNRSKYVIENYPKTPAAYEALVLLRDTYKEMGLIDAARETQAAIDLNSKPLTNSKPSNRHLTKKAEVKKPKADKKPKKVKTKKVKTKKKKKSFWPKIFSKPKKKITLN